MPQSPETSSVGDSFEPILVRASAGTGKTFQLTARLLKILLSGAAPDTILASTFTRKAAGEILTRVLVTLGEASDPSQPAKLDALREQVELPSLPRKACGDLFHRLLKEIHLVRICTLDSLFSQLARSLPFELELPAAWRLSDEIEEVWLREWAVTQMVDSLNASEAETLISMLSRGEVKRNVAGELVSVVQETYSLSRQAAVDAWDALAVLSSPESAELTRAAGQMRSIPVKQKSLRGQLEKVADALDAREFSELVDQTLIKNIHVARRDGTDVKFGRSRFPSDLNADFDLLYAAVTGHALSLLRSQNHATGQVAALYDEIIGQLKHERRVLSFDDVSVRLANVFSSFDSQWLHDQLEQRIDHLLLDEFQDTSPVQWQVLRVLAKSVTASNLVASTTGETDPSASRRCHSFFCVGDTKQAIYGWRGGVAEIFDAVDQEIEGVQAKEQNQSYRSSEVVLSAVTRAFQNLSKHPIATVPDSRDPSERSVYEAESVQRFASRFPDHTAARSLPGYVRFATGPEISMTASDDTEADSKPKKPTAGELHAVLLDEVATQITTLTQAAPTVSVGVLTRTNETAASVIGRLEQHGVNVSGEGGNPLTDSVAVRWIMSALMMCDHPGDGRWYLHVAHSPLASILQIDEDASADESIAKLRARIENEGLADTILWMATELSPNVPSADRSRLRQLVSQAGLFADTTRNRLRDFVTLVETKRVARPRPAQVRVMTIHQSKGLEFDAVFLPEINKDLVGSAPKCIADQPDLSKPPTGLCRSVGEKQWHFLPQRWQQAFGKSYAARVTESLCLLYVAMTRARHGLYLFTPPSGKASFDYKTPASLLYHAWGCEEVDPTVGHQTLWESGDLNWFESISADQVEPTSPDSTQTKQELHLKLMPVDGQPFRNIFPLVV